MHAVPARRTWRHRRPDGVPLGAPQSSCVPARPRPSPPGPLLCPTHTPSCASTAPQGSCSSFTPRHPCSPVSFLWAHPLLPEGDSGTVFLTPHPPQARVQHRPIEQGLWGRLGGGGLLRVMAQPGPKPLFQGLQRQARRVTQSAPLQALPGSRMPRSAEPTLPGRSWEPPLPTCHPGPSPSCPRGCYAHSQGHIPTRCGCGDAR